MFAARRVLRVTIAVALWTLFCGAPRAEEEAPDEAEVAYDQMERLAETILHVRKHYVEEKTYNEIVEGALNGMLRSLDPHSAFLPPRAYEDMQEDTKGSYSGIGIHIGLRDGILTIISPIEDAPGFRAGLQSGDKILEIDGESTIGITLRESVDLLRGEKGSKVALAVRSLNESRARDVDIVRDDIEVPSVKGARLVSDGIGYIRITQFSQPTVASFEESLLSLLDKGMKALVLDLRSNPGGLLDVGVKVAQVFLEDGELIVTTRGREGTFREVERRALGGQKALEIPVAILVNGGTASASEIVAGALQDHRRAVVIGATTYGKGSVQSVVRLRCDPASAIRLTTARYFTPSGREIHEKGLEPDIPVYVPPEEWRGVQIRRANKESPGLFTEEQSAEYTEVIDRALQRAVDLLQGLLIFQNGGS
ncbi:MAG: S41 family peptidase [Lentisphaerae bacterium]|nr:S41 family peptidase [Lentisphaerota bacterium]